MIGTDERLQELRVAQVQTQIMVDAATHAHDFVVAKLRLAHDAEEAARRALGGMQVQRQAAQMRLNRERADARKRLDALDAEIDAQHNARRSLGADAHFAWLQNRHQEARDYSQRARDCMDRVRELHEDKQAIRDDLEPKRKALSDAQADLDEATGALALASRAVEELERDLALARHEMDQAQTALRQIERSFARRVRRIREWEATFRNSWPIIARAAGVPDEYVYHTLVKVNERGQTNVYFGGEGKPDGPGKAHYALDADGVLYYRREIGESHGPQNFIHQPIALQAQPA